jgi:glycosyltransferase involved in cell wall biosynthesis
MMQRETGKPSLLWVNLRLLHPLVGGDRTRTYQMLRQLKEHCHIRYLCPQTPNDTPEAIERAHEYCHELITFPHDPPTTGSWRYRATAAQRLVFGVFPISSVRHQSATAARLISGILSGPDAPDLVVADYLMSFVNFRHLNLAQAPPVIVFQHNVESLIWERHAATTPSALKAALYRRERGLTCKLEARVASEAAGQITVSPEEEAIFRHQRQMTNVLGWVPTGVDCDYFQPPVQEGDPLTLVFLGSMDWHANIDAVHSFVTTTYPLIKRSEPKARLLLIGRNPSPAIRELAEQDASIEVSGTVDDVRPWLARGAIMILPLRVGGGTRIKVYEGMAAGLALVSTRIGVEGLPVRHGEHALLADTPEETATAVLQLVRDPEVRHRLQTTARNWVQNEFSWSSAANRFFDLCRQVLRPAPAPAA